MIDTPSTPNLELIISVDRLRQLCGINDTIDEEYIAPHVEVATDVISQEVLGTKLTKKLITDFNSGSLQGVYEELYAFVEKMVIFQSFKYMLPELWITISNGKITKGAIIDSQPVESSEIALLERRQQAKVARYQDQVVAFLHKRRADIPELEGNSELDAGISPNSSESNGAQGLTATPNITYNFRDF